MNNQPDDWYKIINIDEIDSPALAVYPERIKQNIALLKSLTNGDEWLRPHVKTHKMIEVTGLMQEAGITKFKCATIAEAEMLGLAGVPDVLLAYQPIKPKINRLLQLVQKYPVTQFSCLIDNLKSAESIGNIFAAADLTIPVYLDLNVGMNRTGINPGPEALKLYLACTNMPGIKVVGLHAYDGHLRDLDIVVRKEKCDAAFKPVTDLADQIKTAGNIYPIIVAGGSPTFPIHAQCEGVVCSPGTFIFWDWGYSQLLPEQKFNLAALVITRVISKLNENTLCLDLGHKSVAAENPFPRVIFLNAPDATPISQSEEHLVGDVFYGVPIHICPTTALYDKAQVVQNNQVINKWEVISRNRTIII